MAYVKPKKHLGQHFLTDLSIAERIAQSIEQDESFNKILEIGPGTGVLTQFLLDQPQELTVVDVDGESIEYLNTNFESLKGRIIHGDFLKAPLQDWFDEPFCVAGNFPYNISSQILFKVLDYKDQIPQVVGMFQKEVAERIAAGPGSKTYGVISVLLQAFYEIEYLFTVHENVFNPPPKVKSGVIRLKRNAKSKLDCNEKLFKTVVKNTFNQRRKTIRNSIKPVLNGATFDHELLSKRPEQLGIEQFVELTQTVERVLNENS